MNWDSPFVDLLLGSLIRPLLLVVAAVLALRLFRIRHPASQHSIWMTVLAGMLVAPLVSLVIPHLELRVLPAMPAASPLLKEPGLDGRRAVGKGLQAVEIDPLLLHEQGLPETSASGSLHKDEGR